MNKIEMLQIITSYRMFYPQAFKNFVEIQIDMMANLWLKKFERYTFEEMEIVTDRLTSKSKFMPSVAEIIEELETKKNPVLQLNAEEEWNKVIYGLRTFGSYRKEQAYDTFCEYTKNIVNILTWNRLCESTQEQLIWLKKEFMSMFNNKQDGLQEALSINEKSLTLAELKRLAELNEDKQLLLEEFNEDTKYVE